MIQLCQGRGCTKTRKSSWQEKMLKQNYQEEKQGEDPEKNLATKQVLSMNKPHSVTN